MAVSIHQPPGEISGLTEVDFVIFLGGPTEGTPDWQGEAIQYIASFVSALGGYALRNRELRIANPRRDYLDSTFIHEQQLAWEKQNLKLAAKQGCVLVWLAAQDHDLPREAGQPYAQMTRDELAQTFGWRDYDPGVNIALGIEPDFEGSTLYFEACAKEFGIPILDSLDDTCDRAIRLMTHTAAVAS